MANVYWSCVNMSGISCPVYDASNRKIGDIMPREFFTYIGFEGSLSAVYFMTPSGAMTIGYLHAPSTSVCTPITAHPYGTVTYKGKTYKSFIMRHQQNLYASDGRIVGSVAAGKRAGGWDAVDFVDTGGMRTSTDAGSIALYGS